MGEVVYEKECLFLVTTRQLNKWWPESLNDLGN
jgi:hypothetical protein